MNWKVVIGLVCFILLITLIGTGVYQFTVAEAKGREQKVVLQAEARLEKELAPEQIRFDHVFNGKTQYSVFTIQQEGQAVRAFVPKAGRIETRRVSDGMEIAEVIRQAGNPAEIVSAKYGFEDRALIEIVSKTKVGYDYSYYTYQEGTFIKRLRIN
ncbi:hypothetical protein BLD48_03840 [Exiguobacterium sp. KRL4]|uniref:hypothetical protein n=1 Tax=Exiguobacterium sp. KRL4 TaxID=1914536 RepID=UPI0008F95C7F|nr:hypothetical protein [Exiguobacterium sp. KRL4]OIN67991.1 hypothetical protein BLD48_03840 [Exiguobacterium sp. KRL4]